MATFDKEKIIEQLESLNNLPQVKEVKALRQRLERELERFAEKQVEKIPETTGSANVKRSSKLSRYWRYVRLVRDNFPNLKVKQIRSQLKKRQQGGESDIPDAVWQNPSP